MPEKYFCCCFVCGEGANVRCPFRLLHLRSNTEQSQDVSRQLFLSQLSSDSDCNRFFSEFFSISAPLSKLAICNKLLVINDSTTTQVFRYISLPCEILMSVYEYINISQGSVKNCLRCGGIFNDHLVKIYTLRSKAVMS